MFVRRRRTSRSTPSHYTTLLRPVCRTPGEGHDDSATSGNRCPCTLADSGVSAQSRLKCCRLFAEYVERRARDTTTAPRLEIAAHVRWLILEFQRNPD